jgi:predicted transcriptional regulator
MTNETTSPVDDSEIPVRYEVAGQIIEIEKVNRLVRRFLVSQTKKLRKKHAYLKDVRDGEGNRPTLVIQQIKAGSLSINAIVEFPESLAGEVHDADKADRVA